MYYCYLNSPIGDLLLAGDESALSLIGFPKGKMRHDPEPDWIFNEKPFVAARQQLAEYFAGDRKDFDLPLPLWPIKATVCPALSVKLKSLKTVTWRSTSWYVLLMFCTFIIQLPGCSKKPEITCVGSALHMSYLKDWLKAKTKSKKRFNHRGHREHREKLKNQHQPRLFS